MAKVKRIILCLDEECEAILAAEKAKGWPMSSVVRNAIKNMAKAPPLLEVPASSARTLEIIPGKTYLDVPMPGKVIQNRAMFLKKRLENPNDDVGQNDIILFLNSLL